MMKNVLIATALISMSTAAVAGPSEGDWEVVFSTAGGGFSTTGDHSSLNAGIRAGKFISGSVHEVGFAANLGVADDGNGSSERVDLGGFYRYNMATADSTEWLYGGVELDLWNVTESDLSSETIRPHFGKKWMLSDDIAFDINGGIVIPTDSALDETFDVQFGLSLFF